MSGIPKCLTTKNQNMLKSIQHSLFMSKDENYAFSLHPVE